MEVDYSLASRPGDQEGLLLVRSQVKRHDVEELLYQLTYSKRSQKKFRTDLTRR